MLNPRKRCSRTNHAFKSEQTERVVRPIQQIDRTAGRGIYFCDLERVSKRTELVALKTSELNLRVFFSLTCRVLMSPLPTPKYPSPR